MHAPGILFDKKKKVALIGGVSIALLCLLGFVLTSEDSTCSGYTRPETLQDNLEPEGEVGDSALP